MKQPHKSSRRRAVTAAVMETIESRQMLSVSASWSEVTISSAAKTADSALNNYRTFDLKVSVSSGDDWVGGSMKVSLSGGSFYAPSGSGNTPQTSQFSTHANLIYDTYVSAENFTNPILLGLSSFPPGRPGSALFNSNTIDVTWGALNTTGAGTFTVARLTIAKTAVGSVQAYVTHTGNANDKITANTSLPIGAVVGGSISGKVWNDANGNGVIDSGEAGVSGRTVYLDPNNNSILDASETRVTTDGSGNYTFSNLAAGTYKVREVLPSGWSQTLPTSNFGNNATLTTGQNVTGKNFGTRQTTTTNTGRISGTVFHDFDRDAFRDSGDTGLSGWTVYIDLDNDSILDSNERRVTTDSSGNYSFGSLAAGTYKIRVVRPSGWVQTTPSNNFGHTVTISTGQSIGGENFGMDN